jgi:hypothetical protein
VNGEGVRTAGTRDHHGSPAGARALTVRARPHMADMSVRRPTAGVPPSGHPSPRSAPALRLTCRNSRNLSRRASIHVRITRSAASSEISRRAVLAGQQG